MEFKGNLKKEETKNLLLFVSKTIMYSLILLALVYLYHYSAVGGGSFIYNQF